MNEQEVIARILRIGFVVYADGFQDAREFLEEMRAKSLVPRTVTRGKSVVINWVKGKPISLPEEVYVSADPTVYSNGKSSAPLRAPREPRHRDYKDWSTLELIGLARKHGYKETLAPNAGVQRMRLLNFIRHHVKEQQ